MTRYPSDPQTSLNKLGKIVRKLDLRSNTFLLIKQGTPLATMEAMNGLSQVISERTNLSNVVLAVVESFDDLSLLNEMQMNELGWFHIEHLKRIADGLPKEKADADDTSQPAL